MDVFIAVLLVIILVVQGLTYYSLAYLFSWLRTRVITPTEVVTEEQDSSDETPQEDNSRGMYL